MILSQSRTSCGSAGRACGRQGSVETGGRDVGDAWARHRTRHRTCHRRLTVPCNECDCDRLVRKHVDQVVHHRGVGPPSKDVVLRVASASCGAVQRQHAKRLHHGEKHVKQPMVAHHHGRQLRVGEELHADVNHPHCDIALVAVGVSVIAQQRVQGGLDQ